MLVLAGKASPQEKRETSAEPLRKQVSRIKARWLQRVMYSKAKQIEKNFAFVIFDYLNCVTRDAWPSQETIAKRLHCSTKTVQRAAEGLERRQLLSIMRPQKRGAGHRYSPVFIAEDLDTDDLKKGQNCPEVTDVIVHQSSSSTHIKPASIGGRGNGASWCPNSSYRPTERGKWESELAMRLGENGMDVLDRLAAIDDRIVADLCRGLCDGEVGERELEAARLAAQQAGMRS